MQKASPPVAGAVCWERLLFQQIKRPMLRFNAMPELIEKEDGQRVNIVNICSLTAEGVLTSFISPKVVNLVGQFLSHNQFCISDSASIKIYSFIKFTSSVLK